MVDRGRGIEVDGAVSTDPPFEDGIIVLPVAAFALDVEASSDALGEEVTDAGILEGGIRGK